MIEYGHRLAAAAVSGLVTALAAYAWWLRHRPPPPSTALHRPGVAAYVALALLILQIALGAVTVKLSLPPWTVILHLGTAMLLLATLLVAARGMRVAPPFPAGLTALAPPPPVRAERARAGACADSLRARSHRCRR